MLSLIARYLKASSQAARQDEQTRLLQKEAAHVRAEIDDMRWQPKNMQQASGYETRAAAAHVNAENERLETLRDSFREQFRGAVMDTAMDIATIKTDELRELARATAYARFLSNALPELRPFVHQALGPCATPLILQ